MNIGIIGYGSMGRMLTEKFAAAGKPEDGSIFVSSRTKEKLHSLQAGVNGCGSNSEAAAQADVVFLCVKPGDMKDILTDDFIAEHGRPDVIITDPPRAGMHPDVINVILNAAPQRIVYVSCNPATQARDLQLLDVKYKVEAVQPVDMFPQTHHVENVVLLTLRIHN